MPDADLMDDVVFTLPIMKDLGDQVLITSKSITCLSPAGLVRAEQNRDSGIRDSGIFRNH